LAFIKESFEKLEGRNACHGGVMTMPNGGPPKWIQFFFSKNHTGKSETVLVFLGKKWQIKAKPGHNAVEGKK